MKKIVFASHNKGKIKEVKAILSEYEILSLADIGFFDDIEETGTTFEENSFIKAKAVYDFCHLPSLADDSGLCVDALGGAPGVYSARYAGEDGNDFKNRKLLLENMRGEKNRRAKFVTAATYIDENGAVTKAFGETHGSILFEETGLNGFGYDCLFFSDDLNKSFGLATESEKDGVSHRARAMKNLFDKLKNQ